MKHRLFIGLRPPREIRAALIATMGGIGGARWQSDDQLHLTLRYVGEVDGRLAEEVAVAISRVRAAPVSVALDGCGRFDKQGRTDTIWAGVSPHHALIALHRKVDRAVVATGLPTDTRAYLPHITLARLRLALGAEAEVHAFLVQRAGLSSPPFDFTHIALFESHLTRDGARYDVVERWPLDG